MDSPAGENARLGWPRAIVTALAVLVVAIGLLVYASNLILTRFHGVSRSGRVGLATTWFFVVLVALVWTLRWLQRRRLI